MYKDDLGPFLIGLGVGIIFGVMLVVSSLDNYAKISKNDDGWYANYENRIFHLVEVKTVTEKEAK